jgi:transcriptional regulator with XRE-family HTH domain
MEETVGELIARVREHLGKSQYALAAALREVSGRSDGVPDRGMVARWETGSPGHGGQIRRVIRNVPSRRGRGGCGTSWHILAASIW